MWDLLKVSLPEWKLPLQEWEKQLMEQQELEKKGEETMPSVSCSRGEGADGARGTCPTMVLPHTHLCYWQKYRKSFICYGSKKRVKVYA